MTLPRANRRLISRSTLVLLALVALAILFVGTPTASADEPPSPPHADAPEAPGGLRVYPGGSEELVASWRAPYYDGGSPITEYRVQWKSGSEDYDDSASSTRQAVIADTARPTHTIGGLRSGTEYTVRVIATNIAGDGPPSLEESATTRSESGPKSGDEADGSRVGYGGDGVYTWWDGDREMRVRIEPDEDPQRYGGGEGEPVFRSDSGGGVMTLPGGVLLALDPTWSSSKVDAFFSKNKIKRNRVSELGFLDNAFFVETEPGFPSLQLANDLAAQEGVIISTPNWASEIETHQTPPEDEDDHGDTIDTATALPLNTRMSGVIHSYGDMDVFSFQVSESTLVAVGNFKEGEEGGLDALDGNSFTVVDTSDSILNFFVHGYNLVRLEAGTYYAKVDNKSYTPDTSRWEYNIEVRTIPDQGDTIKTAADISVQSDYSVFADLHSLRDVDIFKIVVDTPTEVIVDATLRPWIWILFFGGGGGPIVPINVDLLDGSGDLLHLPSDGFPGSRAYRLDPAGTYYLRISSSSYLRASDVRPYVIRLFENSEYTEYIEGCADITADSIDPLFGCQWHLDNDGDNEGTPGNDINLGDVWQTTRGEGVNVAIIDQTVESDHEDLTENWNADLSHDYRYSADTLSDQDHGTAVAGIVAARDNGEGIIGVAPRASIVGYNLLSGNSSLATALDAFTRNMEDIAVSNNSWGHLYGSYLMASQLWTEALKAGATRGMDGKGIFYVFAAGNSHEYGHHVNLAESKNSYFQTLACAVDSDGTRKYYSETGSALWVCAPSASVTTDNLNRYRHDFGGTSAASPVVAGVAALVRSANPSLTWRDVKLILAESAQKTDPDNAAWKEGALEYGSRTERYFYNPEYGFGVVDTTEAVALAESWTNLPPMESVSASSGWIDLPIPDFTDEDGPTTVSRELLLSSEVGFTEFVEITVEFDHPSFQNLEIEIQSPAGTVSTLTVPRESGGNTELDTWFRFGSAAHLGEDPSGVWTLRLADHAAGRKGKIAAWSIKVYGHGEGVAVPRTLVLPEDRDWVEAPELTAPETPGQTVVSPGDGRLTVRWLAPEEENGSEVTAYTVRWSAWDAPADVFEVTVTDLTSLTDGDEYAVQIPWLTNGIEYTVRVIAVSGNGERELEEVRAIPAIPGVAGIPVDICNRTEQVRDAILAKLWDTNDCSLVTSVQLQSLRGKLDLRGSGIDSLLVEDFRYLTNLEILYLDYNTLSGLPDGVFDSLTNLWLLRLSGNDLSTLPDGVFDNLTNLEVLDLSWNFFLTTLPDGVFDNLINLEYLDLSVNHLSALPDGAFDNLTNLNNLYLDGGDHSTLPDGIFDNLTSLEQLDLGGNDLSALADGIFDRLTSLERLDLGGNDLSTLPEGIFDGLTSLERLDLGGNDLSTPPEGIFDDLTGLEYLSLRANGLSTLSDGVFDNLTELRSLDLTRNAFSALPDAFDNLPKLWLLRLGWNGLSTLPEGVFDNLTNLQSLYLNDNNLHVSSDAFDNLPKLRSLYLSGNGLSTLPDGVFDNLVGLNTLRLDDNEFNVLPDAFDNLPNLYSLHLENNGLSTLPDGVFDDLTDLKYLYLSRNSLSTLPDGVFDNLIGLEDLRLTDNSLSTLPDGVFDNLARLKYLHLENNGLSTLPEGVFDGLIGLSGLHLRENGLSNLPDGIFDNLTSLRSLMLSENDLSSLPDGVFDDLTDLYTLHLLENDLSVLPEGVFDGLTRLERLHLYDNDLSALPDGVFDGLTKLELLSLSGNDLSALPEGVFDGLTKLESLTLSRNDLAALPVRVFDSLSNLEDLYLYENDLSELPDDLFEGLRNLRRLELRDNPGEPFTFMAELVQGGEDAVAVETGQAVPFDMAVSLSGQGGALSTASVTVFAGTSRSEEIQVTPDADEPVTVTVASAVFEPSAPSGIVSVEASFFWDFEYDRYYFDGIEASIGPALTLGDIVANTPATGAPTITGTARVGETLTVDTTAISDADGLDNVGYSYQWLADDTEIAGATDPTYTPVADDVGKAIKVQVTFIDDRDFEESLASEATEAVVPAATSADDGAIWSATMTVGGSGTYYGYSSFSETGELSPKEFSLEGSDYTVWVLGEDDGGQAYLILNQEIPVDFVLQLGAVRLVSKDAETQDLGSAYHYQWDVGTVSLSVGDKVEVGLRTDNNPATGAPTIGGTPQVGETLTVDTSGIDDADGIGNATFSYQWIAGTTDISGATGSTYAPVAADAGKAIKVRVSFDDDQNNFESLTSEATAAVAAKPNTPATGAPAISGTAQVGETLTVDTSGIDDVDGMSGAVFSYQWLANEVNIDTDIAGATDPTYTPVADDVGKAIKVQVTFIDDRDFEESLASEATATVVTPLTAEFQDAPDKHLGTGVFTFDIAFSEPISIGYVTLRDDSLEVTNGSATKAKRVNGQSDLWKITVEPDSDADVTVVLPITEDCGSDGAVCTRDGTKLSNRSELTVPGPAAANAPATGLPTISGTAQVGETLTVDTSGIDDADGIGNATFSYQWIAGTTDISGATGSTYAPVAADAGKAIKVRVSFDDDQNNFESLTSEATAAVAAKPNTPATGAPAISGTAQVGETLTVDTSGIDDVDGMSGAVFSYQWLANEVNIDTEIAGATDPTYTPVADDVGKAIKVQVTFIDDRDFEESLASEATATVVTPLTAEFQDAPDKHLGTGVFTFDIAFSEPISIGYVTLRDDSLEVTNGSATKAKRVNGQSDLWKITVEPDSDADVTVVLPITEDCGSDGAVCTRDGTKLSNRSELTVPGPAAANAPATGLPTISGTAQVGETLTVDTSGIDDADGIGNATFSYQWIAGTTDISGATGSTYAPVAADAGKAIKVRVSFDDDQNNFESLTSEATAAVAAKPNTPATGLPTISGTAQVGETLTASASDIDDADGIGNATFSYQWIAGTTDITGATGSSYAPLVADLGKTIKVRVSFDDDDDNEETLTSEATATVVTPLTAEFRDAPDKHLGTGVFTFEIAFSEPISIGYVTLRDDSLDVTNGSATKAKRLDGQSDLWEITVEPDSNAAVTVVLPITEDCESDGAVCTRDGTELSNRSELTVPGPAAANSPATGAPIISGTARVGETLTVDTSGIDDADGMSGAVFSYQWLADGVDIAGATSDTYTPVADDVGKAVKVRVIFNDDDDNEETLTSPATAAVAAETAAPDAPQSLNVSPDDTGTLDVSWEAPASDGGSAITGYKVQWKSGSEDYDGSAGSTRQAETTDPASRTHTITGLTNGVEYGVRVIAVNDVGDGPPSDEATGTPRETTPPELATATVDGTTLTLTYDKDLDENSEPSSDAFSVTVGGTGRAVDGVSVSGSSVILTLGSAVTSEDTVTVSYTVPTDAAASRILDETGNAAAYFNGEPVANNTPPPANTPATGAPTISGTAQVGKTLTAETSAIADADGMSGAVFTYQWLANGADIAGATSDTYTLVADDVSKAIQVRVIFTDNADNEETLTSEATAAVEPRPNSPATGAPTIGGTVRVGETLTASTSDIDDADGMSKAVFSYQWLANGAEIAGATSDTYTLVDADLDKAVKVRVIFTDNRSHQETLTSEATAAVATAADESAVWSATLTVGSIAGFRGFWKDVGMGELTSEVFTLDGVDYTVKVLSDTNGLQFDLTLDKALPVGFTLQVGATTLSSQDASIREYSSGATQYGWANQGVMLADGDTVQISLTLAE